VAAISPQRARDDIVRLAHKGLGVRDFSLAAARSLRRAVPYDGVCVVTMDPATLLPTGHVIENGLPDATLPRYTEIEIREPDFNKFAALAGARPPAASLSAATEGRLERSARHRELRRPNGFGGDELRAVFAGDAGTWGALVLLRETGRRDFTPGDTRLVASLSHELAEGLRRALLLTALSESDGDGDQGPGLLLLADDNTIELANPAARAWLAELGGDDGRAPFVVRNVAVRARAVAGGDDGAIARARVRTPSGRWVLVRGSMLGGRAAVIVEPVRPAELAPLFADAYELTERERAVAQLVARGLSTDAIGGRLHISPYTVQDHLKSIFDKVGVGSRGELVARLFFDHYAPELT
jgi:DNA-binding CsgD family transcriptional regulator